jgi:hypothetical protein
MDVADIEHAGYIGSALTAAMNCGVNDRDVSVLLRPYGESP